MRGSGHPRKWGGSGGGWGAAVGAATGWWRERAPQVARTLLPLLPLLRLRVCRLPRRCGLLRRRRRRIPQLVRAATGAAADPIERPSRRRVAVGVAAAAVHSRRLGRPPRRILPLLRCRALHRIGRARELGGEAAARALLLRGERCRRLARRARRTQRHRTRRWDRRHRRAVDAQRVLEAADGGVVARRAARTRPPAAANACVWPPSAKRFAGCVDETSAPSRRTRCWPLSRPCCSTTSCSAGADLIGVRSAAAHDGRAAAKRQRTCTTSSRSAAAVSTASGGGIFAIFGTDGGVRLAEAGDAAQACGSGSREGGGGAVRVRVGGRRLAGPAVLRISEAFRFWLELSLE